MSTLVDGLAYQVTFRQSEDWQDDLYIVDDAGDPVPALDGEAMELIVTHRDGTAVTLPIARDASAPNLWRYSIPNAVTSAYPLGLYRGDLVQLLNDSRSALMSVFLFHVTRGAPC